MGQWLKRIVGGSEGGLPALLKSYPPYFGPFPGAGYALLPEQADANLAHLLAHRQQRLTAVLELLVARGVDTEGALSLDDPRPFLDRVWKWIAAEWPSIHSKHLARFDACRNPRGDGAEKALSLVTDVGILLGEMVLARKPDFGWALDLAPGNQRYENGSVSQKQPVVARGGNLPVGDILFDPVGGVEGKFVYCCDPTTFWVNPLARAVMDVVGGNEEHAAAERERAWQ